MTKSIVPEPNQEQLTSVMAPQFGVPSGVKPVRGSRTLRHARPTWNSAK